ncbi:MAG: hypothetical protein JHD31_05005 [Rhodoluna sp.]|nr:hypothetical protein [Rhodoluna sp.]
MTTYRGFTQEQIVALIDHTLLKPEATEADLDACINTAIEARCQGNVYQTYGCGLFS